MGTRGSWCSVTLSTSVMLKIVDLDSLVEMLLLRAWGSFNDIREDWLEIPSLMCQVDLSLQGSSPTTSGEGGLLKGLMDLSDSAILSGCLLSRGSFIGSVAGTFGTVSSRC